MNMQFPDRGPKDERLAPTSAPRRLPFLAQLSGRNREVLAKCPSDVIAQSSSLGAALLVAAALHAIGLTAALIILNVPVEFAVVAAAITSLGLFALDRNVVHSVDTAGAQAAMRRIGASTLSDLSHWTHGSIKLVLRTLFSVFTAIVIGGSLTLHLFAPDAAMELDRRQIEIDRPFMDEANAQLDVEREAMTLRVERVDAATSQEVDRARKRVEAQQEKVGAAETRVERMQGELHLLVDRLDAARIEVARQRDIMHCEVSGVTETCPGTSGIIGIGRRSELAKSRAIEAEAAIEAILSAMLSAEQGLREAESTLRDVRRMALDAPADALPSMGDDPVVAAMAALAAFDASRTARVAALVAVNPLRETIEKTSLANQLSALKSLAGRDTAFLIAVVAVKLFTFAMEMMAIIGAHFMHRSEYHLHRGRILHNAARELQNRNNDDFLDDARLREAVRKQVWEETKEEMATDIFAAGAKAAVSQDTVHN